MKRYARLIVLFSFLLTNSWAQQSISLENIWGTYTFQTRSVPGFNFQKDGRHYTRLEGNKINQYDLTTGKFTKTLFDAAQVKGGADYNGEIDGYTFSDDEQKILISTETEAIYRRSSRSNFYIWDGAKLTALFKPGKQLNATFNPTADKVAFVYENNMYYKDLLTGGIVQITKDGKVNEVINGLADWVYEEEFSIVRTFEWAPDGQKIAYIRFDESEVPEFTMTNYRDDLYPEYVTFKYPKVGAVNSKVEVFIYDLSSRQTVPVAVGAGLNGDFYIPRINWTQDPNQLCVFQMNRHQNELQLLLANATTGSTTPLLKETNEYYIDIHDHLTFLKDGKHFVWTSEQDGWNHIYLYQMDGKLKQQLTSGNWEVTTFYGVDELNNKIYYQATERSPLERQVYEIGLDGKNKRVLTPKDGWNSAQFSSTFDYFVNNHSTRNTPPSYTVYNRGGQGVRTIVDNQQVKNLQETYGVQPVEFFDFTTEADVRLNGYMIKPANFDRSKSYPVLMYVYGGPGSQQVTDQWGGQNYWWFQMLAQQGFVIACVDNRGTGGRGEAFKKMTYLQLGRYETIDQIEAANYLGGLPYIDEEKIGIFGWSYGGYMSSLAILKGNEVFNAAIAVAPVTNWKWYDTIYTERYMRTTEENPTGYRENSPVYFADRLKGNYLLIHGMGDDNVHFQHSVEMAGALIAANKQFETYYYPNRNHGIYGGNTRLHLYRKMTDFLVNHLQ